MRTFELLKLLQKTVNADKILQEYPIFSVPLHSNYKNAISALQKMMLNYIVVQRPPFEGMIYSFQSKKTSLTNEFKKDN